MASKDTFRQAVPLAERETARVNVHLGDADESQRGREAEPRGDRTFTQQVRQLVPLLEAEGGVVEHPAMQVARLLYLQLVDVAPEPHELPRQLLVLQAHVCLMERDGKQWCSEQQTDFVTFGQSQASRYPRFPVFMLSNNSLHLVHNI